MNTGKERDELSWMLLPQSSQDSEGDQPHEEESLKHFLERQSLPWEGELNLKWQQELTAMEKDEDH